jgi:hypothetical protein
MTREQSAHLGMMLTIVALIGWGGTGFHDNFFTVIGVVAVIWATIVGIAHLWQNRPKDP